MSFWRTFGFHAVSAVETILERDNFTLEDLLDEEELLQECKSQNQKLLEYILLPDTLAKLLDYLTKDPREDSDSKARFKYPYLACEILCLEVWDICEAIYENATLLNQLWGFLDAKPPLNHLTGNYVSRVAGILLQRKINETVIYLKKKENIIDKFIQHLGNAAVMELLLKLIACEETAEGTGIVKWLSDEGLIPALVSKFDPKLPSDIHENASQTLVDIITLSHSLQASPLIDQLESEPILSQIFSFILNSDSKSVLLHGLSVAIELLKREQAEETDETTKVEQLNPSLKLMLQSLEKFVNIVRTNNGDSNQILLSFGNVVPVGMHRIRIIEFFAALHSRRYLCIDELLLKMGVFTTCLDLFFAYYWNNFLHMIVQDVLLSILDSGNESLVLSLLQECNLINRIVQASSENQDDQNKPKGSTRGYMGFVTNISNKIIQRAEVSKPIQDLLLANAGWQEYANGALKIQTKVEREILGGAKPTAIEDAPSSGDEGSLDAQGNSELVNVFTQYLVKQGFSSGDFPKNLMDDDDDLDEDEDDDEETGDLVLDKEFEEPGNSYSTDESEDGQHDSDEDADGSDDDIEEDDGDGGNAGKGDESMSGDNDKGDDVSNGNFSPMSPASEEICV